MLKKTPIQDGNISDIEFIEKILHKNGSTLECGYDRGSLVSCDESINKRSDEPSRNQANISSQDSYSVNSTLQHNVLMLREQDKVYNTQHNHNIKKQSTNRNRELELNDSSCGAATGNGTVYRTKILTTESAVDSRRKAMHNHKITTAIPHAQRLQKNQICSAKTARLVSVGGKSVITPQINFCGMYGNIATNLKHNRSVLDEIVKNCTIRMK